MPQAFTATIAECRSITEELKWFRLRLSKPMDFLPGQYLSIRFPGEKRYHAFSIASGPAKKEEVELLVKREQEFTTRMLDSPPGTAFECLGPMGRFMEDPSLQGDLVMVAGGVGVTPFLSVVRHARDAQKQDRDYWLFYSCRTREQLGFEEELRQMAAQNPRIHVVLTLTRETPAGWDRETGHVDKAMLEQHLGSLEGKTFATCGPTKMVEAIIAMLKASGIPDERILHESWG